APKKVRLNLKDTPVIDAVDELVRQSGYNIQIQGEVAALVKRKVTLDTGATTFWQAFDLLCDKAGLVEIAAQTPNAHPLQNHPRLAPGRQPFRPNPGRPGVEPEPVEPEIRQINVEDGSPQKVPTAYVGALRLRLLPTDRVRQDEVDLVLDVSLEPKVPGFSA